MKRYQCLVCGWVYDEQLGWPQEGITEGTPWQDVPENWTCPDCGISKADFDMVEV
jgi:rubredoxin